MGQGGFLVPSGSATGIHIFEYGIKNCLLQQMSLVFKNKCMAYSLIVSVYCHPHMYGKGSVFTAFILFSPNAMEGGGLVWMGNGELGR